MFLGSALGLQGGSNGGAGMNFSAQGPATPIQQGTSTAQTTQAFNAAQQGLGYQQSFADALAAQNGIQNQGNVFAQQQALAGQLQGVANGTGPNPALQQLQNTTGQNISNQAALMAGQRGAGANVGLMARQNAMQGANLQQQAVGQGAVLTAQQQLAGMQALQAQQAQMAGLAGSQVNQQAGAIQGYNAGLQGEQGTLQQSLANFNNANVGMQSNINASNANVAGHTAQEQGNILSGVAGDVGQAAQALFAQGGEVEGPRSKAGQHLKMAKGGNVPLNGTAYANQAKTIPGKAEVKGDSLKNDKVKAMLSPGEAVLPRHIMNSPNAPEMAKQFVAALLAKKGMSGGKKS